MLYFIRFLKILSRMYLQEICLEGIINRSTKLSSILDTMTLFPVDLRW